MAVFHAKVAQNGVFECKFKINVISVVKISAMYNSRAKLAAKSKNPKNILDFFHFRSFLQPIHRIFTFFHRKTPSCARYGQRP